MYLLPSLPVRHQGERETCSAFTGASIAEYHFPSIGRLSPEFIYYHQATPRGMYGRNVFQILQKKGISTEDEFSYGTTERPSDEAYQSAQRRRLSSFSRIHTIDGAKLKTAQCSLLCLYIIAALPSGRAIMTCPMIFMLFPLRAMIATVSSSGTPGAQTGATMVVATCHLSTGVGL